MEEEKKHKDQTQSEEEILDNTDAAESELEEKSETADEIIQKLNEEIESLKDQRLRAVAELENFSLYLFY